MIQFYSMWTTHHNLKVCVSTYFFPDLQSSGIHRSFVDKHLRFVKLYFQVKRIYVHNIFTYIFSSSYGSAACNLSSTLRRFSAPVGQGKKNEPYARHSYERTQRKKYRQWFIAEWNKSSSSETLLKLNGCLYYGRFTGMERMEIVVSGHVNKIRIADMRYFFTAIENGANTCSFAQKVICATRLMDD